MLCEDSSCKQPKVLANKIPKSVTDSPFCEDDAGQHQPASDLIFFCFDYKRSLMPVWQIRSGRETATGPTRRPKKPFAGKGAGTEC